MIFTLASKEAPKSKVRQIRINGKKELYEGMSAQKKTELRYHTSVLTLDKEINSFSEHIDQAKLIRQEDTDLYTIIEADSASLIFETGEIMAHEMIVKKIKSSTFPNDSDEGLFFFGTAKKGYGNLLKGTNFTAFDLKGQFVERTP